MRKYLYLIRFGFIDAFAWRGNLVYWIIVDILGVAIVPFLWLAAMHANGKPIGGFAAADIITYFIGVTLIWQGIVTYPFWYIIRDVRDGQLANDLVRPYSYFSKHFFYNLGARATRLIILIPFLIPILFILRNYLIIPTSALQVLMFVIALAVAYFLIFVLHFVIGIVAFWFHEGFAVAMLFAYVFGVFSGDFAPLTLLPQWLKTVANFLPFQYIINFPLQIYLGNVDTTLFIEQLLRALLWCVGVYTFYRIAWAQGLKAFTGVGR